MAENIIIAVLSLIGGGSISGFIFWRATKRKALSDAKKAEEEARKMEEEANRVSIDNAVTVTDQWQGLYEEIKSRLDKTEAELKEEIEKERQNFEKERVRAESIYAEYLALREDKDARIRDLSAENHNLFNKIESLKDESFKKDIELERLMIQKCEVRGCTNRKPPSELMM